MQQSVKSITTLDEYNEAKEQLRMLAYENGKQLITAEFKKFFAAHPEVSKIAFTAYTPFFNDGDSCEYMVHEYHCWIPALDTTPDNVDTDESFDSHWDWHSYTSFFNWNWHAPPEEKQTIKPEIAELSTTLPEDFRVLMVKTNDEDLCRVVYGDHVLITVTPDAIIVDEYDHD